MKIGSFGIGAMAMVLSACGNDADTRVGAEGAAAPSSAEVARRAQDMVRPEPGQYRATMELLEADFPGAPPQVAEMMRQSRSAGQSHEYCLTPEDVEKGFSESVRRSQTGDCAYERFDVSRGKFDAAMICKEGGQEVRIAISGTGDETSSDMTMAMEMDMPGIGKGTMRMRSRNERIGPCPG